jgi:DNA-binding MarR family transcriptional regulator
VLGARTASPKELAQECGETIGDVSYHVKYLHREGWIEMFDTEARRGAIEHYYRLKASSGACADTIRSLIGEVVRALNAGAIAADGDGHLSWMTTTLDEEGWRELAECQARWAEELSRVRDKAAKRLAATGQAGVPAVAGTLAFEAPPG